MQMKGIRAVLLTAAVLTLAGCKKDDKSPWTIISQSSKPVDISTVSPDATVKSWWNLRDAESKFSKVVCEQTVRLNQMETQSKELTTGAVGAYFSTYSEHACSQNRYEREISKVDIQSDTMAFVYAQITNASPPEHGYSLTMEDKKQKKEGDAFKYLVVRKDAKSEWKISKIFVRDRYATDPTEYWRSLYSGSLGRGNVYVNGFQQ